MNYGSILKRLTKDIGNHTHTLLGFLGRRRRGTVQPQGAKHHPAADGDGDAGNPHPGGADGPAARVLVVRKVAQGDGVLFVYIGDERPFVVHPEGEDAVLVGRAQRRCIGARFGRARQR